MTQLAEVLAANHLDLQTVAADLPTLLVSRSALTRVLNEWRSGHCAAHDVQQWASFVRRGYVSGKAKHPLSPIDIDYEPRDEEMMVEIIARLDEIGDLIDGCVNDEEQAEMLRTLAG